MFIDPLILKTMNLAVNRGAELFKMSWGKIKSVAEKSNEIGNLVTEVDKAIEEVMVHIINRYLPEHAVLGEETCSETSIQSPDHLWIIDPIDGTNNFVHQIPLCCICIAYLYKGQIQASTIFNPILDEYYFAKKGGGAFLNEQPISVSDTDSLRSALLISGSFKRTLFRSEAIFNQYLELLYQTCGIRRLGSAAMDLAWVAAGRADGFWEYDLKPWDIAAGALLVQEAGGVISNLDGSDLDLMSGSILAAPKGIYSKLSDYFKL